MAAKSHKPLNTYLFENLSRQKGITHFITTRKGGVSRKPFDTLNLGFNVPDDPKHVAKNRALLAEALGFPIGSLTTAKQVHGNKVAIVNKGQRGRELDGFDAMITDVPGICLMVQIADCPPLLLYDPVHKVIGAVHAGWRGTVKKIAFNAVMSMSKIFKSDPHNIYVGIGPSIGPCCYEVGDEVVREVADKLNDPDELIIKRNGKDYFDLWEANKRQLIEAGVPGSNIEVSGICTKDNSDTFFSSRASNGLTGRFGAGIMLAKP